MQLSESKKRRARKRGPVPCVGLYPLKKREKRNTKKTARLQSLKKGEGKTGGRKSFELQC